MKSKYRIAAETNLASIKEKIKQKIQVKAQRLRRFDKRHHFYRHNWMFRTDAKKFYREIGRQSIEITEPPPIEEVEKFWKGIWSNEQTFDTDAPWLERETKRMADKNEQEWSNFTAGEVVDALRKAHKWKTPGVDKIPNFWLNALTSAHTLLSKTLSNGIHCPHRLPAWLSTGVTYSLTQEWQYEKSEKL